MSTHSTPELPLVGIAYASGAVGCAIWAMRSKANRILWPLTGLIFSIAILNSCVEGWRVLNRFRLDYGVLVLIMIFVLPYRSFCLHLIERTGLRPGFAKEQYSGLILLYAGFVATAIVVPLFAQGENYAFTLFAFIVCMCALQVPAFAFGRSKVNEFVARSGITPLQAAPDISWSFLMTAGFILGIPLVLAFIFDVVGHDDYRLFTVDAVLTAVVFSLLFVSRSSPSGGLAQKQRASHRSGRSDLSQPF